MDKGGGNKAVASYPGRSQKYEANKADERIERIITERWEKGKEEWRK